MGIPFFLSEYYLFINIVLNQNIVTNLTRTLQSSHFFFFFFGGGGGGWGAIFYSIF
jgi:hypothetical protein